MKIAVRGGHCPKATGASALLNELIEDRKVKDAVVKYLKQLGHDVLDVTPPDSTSTSASDLSYGVSKANEWGADLFVSIHFNKAYNSYNGAIGSEVCVYSNFDVAQRVVDGLGTLGFKNRGQKVRKELYELRNTSMTAMIIETCFVEATEDVELYRRLGADTIGKAIAEAITNKKINEGKKENNNEFKEEECPMYLFSENWYLYRYNDVKQAVEKGTFKSGYEHYVRHGKNEKRQPVPPIPEDFNERDYLELNKDVKQAVEKGDCISGAQHYMVNGFKETRKINKGETDEAVKKRIKELESKLDEIKKIVE